jgi:hypothetical protein
MGGHGGLLGGEVSMPAIEERRNSTKALGAAQMSSLRVYEVQQVSTPNTDC